MRVDFDANFHGDFEIAVMLLPGSTVTSIESLCLPESEARLSSQESESSPSTPTTAKVAAAAVIYRFAALSVADTGDVSRLLSLSSFAITRCHHR
jgi:hypothetical protein